MAKKDQKEPESTEEVQEEVVEETTEEAAPEPKEEEAKKEEEGKAEPEAPTEEVAKEDEKPKPKKAKGKAKGKKKDGDGEDVVPGAHLEPIVLEEEKPEKKSSEEELAARYAEGDEEDADSENVEEKKEEKKEEKPEPAVKVSLPSGQTFSATGKRKNAVARVIIQTGKGEIAINKVGYTDYFPRQLLQGYVLRPLVLAGLDGKVDVRARVHGGGVSGQAQAVRHGIAKALLEVDSGLRGMLKSEGLLTRDSRIKERRKAGLKKARKKPQFSKR